MNVIARRLRDAANLGEQALLRRAGEALAGCESVLDVGCGTGSVLEELPRLEHSVGFDAFPSAIERSRARGVHDEYVEGDATELPFAPGSFDAVIAFDLIEHLDKADGAALLAQAEAVARLVVLVFTPNGFIEQDAYDDNPLQVHRAGWSPADFRRAGFEVHGMKGYHRLRGHASVPRRPRALSRIALSASQPLVEQRPELAFALLAVKRLAVTT